MLHTQYKTLWLLYKVLDLKWAKNAGWHQKREGIRRALEKGASQNGSVIVRVSDWRWRRWCLQVTWRNGGGRCKAIQEELSEFVNFTKCRIGFAQNMKVLLRYLWQRGPAASTGTSTWGGRLLNLRGPFQFMVWAGETLQIVSQVVLRPLVIDALFEKFNCCVVNGLGRSVGSSRGWPESCQ